MLTRKDVDAWSKWAQKAYEPLAMAPEADTDAHDPRIAHASEYAAYQLGEINRKLDVLIEMLARRDAKRD